MIAITDTSAFSELEFVETQNLFVIPTEVQIQSLIGTNEFVNTSITSAFKTLLKTISNETYNPANPWFFLQPNSIVESVSIMFRRVGFYLDNGILVFEINTNALDSGTQLIIDTLHPYTNFNDIAENAFFSKYNNWALEANNVRALENTGMQKLYYLSVHNDNNQVDGLNGLIFEYDRVKTIALHPTTDNTLDIYKDPIEPQIHVKNHSNETLRIRLKIEYENYTSRRTNQGRYGPNENFDIDANNTNEIVGLNRRDESFFPETGEVLSIPYEDDHTIVIEPLQTKVIETNDIIIGGKAILEFIPGPIQNIPMVEEEIHRFNFYITGTNPTYGDIRWYLNRERTENGNQITYLDRFWFLMRKIRLESGSGNVPDAINNNEMLQFQTVENNFNTSYGVKWIHSNQRTELRAMGFPTWGYPRGFGLGQIDNLGSIDGLNILALAPDFAIIPLGHTVIDNQNRTLLKTANTTAYIVASSEEIWHWKKNIDTVYNFFTNNKIPVIVLPKIIEIRNAVIAWNNANPTDLVVIPSPVDYRDIRYTWVASTINEFVTYNDLFLEGTPPQTPNPNGLVEISFYDAMLIKSYNGISGGQFMDVDYGSNTNKPILSINETTTSGYNYLLELSRRHD